MELQIKITTYITHLVENIRNVNRNVLKLLTICNNSDKVLPEQAIVGPRSDAPDGLLHNKCPVNRPRE